MSAPRSPFSGPQTWNTRSDFTNIVANVTRQARDPTALDRKYPIGQLWINQSGRRAYILVDLVAGQAFWKLAAVGPDDLEGLTDQFGTEVGPSPAGFIQLSGDAASGTSITADPGNNRLTVRGITWNQAFANVTMAANNGYAALSPGGNLVFTLPLNAPFGSIIRVTLVGATSWRIAQNAGQNIQFGNVATTVGTAGYLESIEQSDSVELICSVANVNWSVLSSQGNITVN